MSAPELVLRDQQLGGTVQVEATRGSRSSDHDEPEGSRGAGVRGRFAAKAAENAGDESAQ